MPPHTVTKHAPIASQALNFGFSEASAQAGTALEVSVRGEWVAVPAVRLHGHAIVTHGRWLKIAAVHDEEWLESPLNDPYAIIAVLRDLPAAERPDIFTFAQRAPESAPRYDFPMEWESLAVASFRSFDEWWNEVPRETRKNIRRAEKRGVTIATHAFDEDLIRGIATIQNECPVRQGRRYQHFGKTPEQVRRDHRSFLERSDFVTAHFEGQMIGVLKLVYCGEVASILQLNSLMAHYDKRPANALLSKAVELCAARDIRQLVYGKFNHGNKRDSGLREFKVRHAFHNLLVPRYYVPLTVLGKASVRMKLYRNLHHILPGWMIQAGLDLRTRYYQRLGS